MIMTLRGSDVDIDETVAFIEVRLKV